MDDFEVELRGIFLQEAKDLLEQAEAGFIELESGNYSAELINQIFRVAHSFKGSAKSVGFDALSKFAHKLEDVLSKIKDGTITINRNVANVLFRSLDILKNYTNGLSADPAFTLDSSDVEIALTQVLEGKSEEVSVVSGAAEVTSAKASATPAPAVATASIPTPTASVATAPKPAAAPASTTAAPPAKTHEAEVIRVATAKLDQLLNVVGELVVNQSMMADYRNTGVISDPKAQQTISYISKIVGEIQDISMSLRMVPVKPLFQKLQRAVRDTASALEKDIDFETIGEHVELDKTLLEKMTDPMTHIVRNAVDHGIESKAERLVNGKMPRATVTVTAEQREDQIVIQVKDDGQGLDRDRILKKAIEKNIVTPEQKLSDEQVYALIFAPGFSTKEQVTEISGRGVGLDVVQRAVDDLKGRIQIQSTPGQGTTFIISLPLSLSIISGMVIGIDDRRYIVPVPQLSETIHYKGQRIETSTNRGRMMNLRGEVIPILSLAEILHGRKAVAQSAPSKTDAGTVSKPAAGLITIWRGKKVSFEVDEIIGQQQIVLKKLGGEIKELPGIIAGAILANGDPSLVLNLQALAELRGNNVA